MNVRPARREDMPALTALYNHYIAESPATFDIKPWTVQQRVEWFSHYDVRGRHRLLVAEEGGRLLGYASSSRYRPKEAYDPSVETSVYVDHTACGRGVGTALYAALFEILASEDVHRAFAGITLPNAASESLHERFGFTRVGIFTEQGRKFGRYWNVAWFEKPLG